MKLLAITISEAFRFFGSSTSSNQCLVIILQFHFRSHTDGGRDQYHHSRDRVRRTKTRGGPWWEMRWKIRQASTWSCNAPQASPASPLQHIKNIISIHSNTDELTFTYLYLHKKEFYATEEHMYRTWSGIVRYPEHVPHTELLSDQRAVLRSPAGQPLNRGTLVRELSSGVTLVRTSGSNPQLMLWYVRTVKS